MSRLPIEIHPEFSDDLAHERGYYGERSQRVLAKLDHELDRGIDAIATDPLRFNKQGLNARGKRLRSFPLSIIFTILSDRILVIALAHAKRRNRYWKHRLK